jgi:NAD+ diphosphatase
MANAEASSSAAPPPAHFGPFKFCPLCASSLETREICERPRLACSKTDCDFVHWENPKPVAVAVVATKEGVVLTRRKYAPEIGTFCLPGGFIEKGESAQEACIREVLEETGLQVEVVSHLGVYPSSDANELIVVFHVKPVGGHLSAGEEVLEVGCFHKHDLPPDIGFDQHRAILEAWFAIEVLHLQPIFTSGS